MAVEKAFQELVRLLRSLRDHLLALQLTAREDLPEQGGVVLVDRFGDAIDDSLGSLEEALAAATAAWRALSPSINWNSALRWLATCQEQLQLLELRFQSELVSYERIKELMAFGRRRRGEWRSWVKSVRQGLEHCKEPLNEVNKALLACWQEIAERAATGPALMHTTDIDAPTEAEAGQLVRHGCV